MPFLDALPPADAQRLSALGGVWHHQAGSALMHDREPGDEVLLVLSGRVKLVSSTPDGREVVLAVREPGDLLGEMSALEGGDRMATAIALEPVDARHIPAAAFLAFVEHTPSAGLALARHLSRRLREADSKRAEHLSLDATGRVAGRLVEMAERFGTPVADGVLIDLAFTQEDLAGWTGSSREAAIRALRALRDTGLITTSRRAVTVHDLDALRRRARP